MEQYTEETLAQAKKIFNYLYIRESPEKADAIIGFGHFDLKIPRQCANLYLQGYASKIFFTGGVGAGSGDFKHPEAMEFLHLVQKEFPQIPKGDIIIETKSTNTGENLRFTEKLLNHINPKFSFVKGIQKVLKVSNAYRQRRAYLTCQKIYPNVTFINCPPPTSFEEEYDLYQFKKQDLVRHLIGEMERMISYPALDFIVPVVIPDEVMDSYNFIRKIAEKYS